MAGQGFRIKVTPEKLDSQAVIVEQYIEKIQSDFDKIRNKVESTKSYWLGEASSKHQEFFSENEKDISTLLKRLKEHPKDLRKMAGVFRETEEKNMELANALPDDIIF